jgi:CotH protein.
MEKKQGVLGMPKHKRWVLLANFMDRTLMRNLVSMKVASLTRLDWTPRCVPVELVLNGVHKGSYLLIGR